MSDKKPRGDPDRIALIHAIYGFAWSVAALGFGLSRAEGTILLAACLAAVVFAGMRLRRARSVRTGSDAAVGRSIRRINIATGAAVALAVVLCAQSGALRLAVPVALTVMALHFIPLWWLLRRSSLLVMAVALLLAASGGLLRTSAVAAALAAIVFLANSVRIQAADRGPDRERQ